MRFESDHTRRYGKQHPFDSCSVTATEDRWPKTGNRMTDSERFDEQMRAAREGRHFWSNGRAWGTCRLRRTASGMRVSLEVLHGEVKIKRFRIGGVGETVFARTRRFKAAQIESWTTTAAGARR